jgi:hypothetical protein
MVESNKNARGDILRYRNFSLRSLEGQCCNRFLRIHAPVLGTSL